MLSMGAKHRFTTPYVPWCNGTVESVCKYVLRVMHVFCSEARVPEAKWPCAVSAILSIVINSTSRRLGSRAPITVHAGMEPGNLLFLALKVAKSRKTKSLDETKVLQKLGVDSSLFTIASIHKKLSRTVSNVRKQAVEHHNSKRHVVSYKSVVEHYLVVARTKVTKTKICTN